MKKSKRSPVIIGILFAAAAVMIATGAVGGAKAAPLITNDRDYTAQMELSDIGIGIVENGTAMTDGQEIMAAVKADFKVGKTYDEELAVTNTGNINEYVRVTVYKYWEDTNGKAVNLDPGLIDIHFVEDGGWTINPDESTTERTVLYYSDVVNVEDTTSIFMDKVTIDGKVSRAISILNGEEKLDYDGITFRIEVVADGVQEHNGTDAMNSAWGHTN